MHSNSISPGENDLYIVLQLYLCTPKILFIAGFVLFKERFCVEDIIVEALRKILKFCIKRQLYLQLKVYCCQLPYRSIFCSLFGSRPSIEIETLTFLSARNQKEHYAKEFVNAFGDICQKNAFQSLKHISRFFTDFLVHSHSASRYQPNMFFSHEMRKHPLHFEKAEKISLLRAPIVLKNLTALHLLNWFRQ